MVIPLCLPTPTSRVDVSMQLVERQCGRYLTMFSDCLQRFPHTWHLDCQRQKVKLAKCAESDPTIVKIKTECEKEFAVYERCMNANPTATHYCLEDFEEFNQCAQRYLPPSEKKKQTDDTSPSNRKR